MISSLTLTGSGALPAQAGPGAVGSRVVGAWSAAVAPRGGWVVVRGSVNTSWLRRTVVLQRLTTSGWHDLVAGRTVGGAYRLQVPTSTVGAAWYRVRVAPSGRYAGAVTVPSRLLVRATVPGNPAAFALLSRESEASAPVARWNPCAPIRYRVNLTRSSAGALADVQAALARVHTLTGLTFAYAGTTTFVPTTTANYPAGVDLVLGWVVPGSTDLFPRATSGYDAAGYGGAAWENLTLDGVARSQITKGYALFNARLPLAAGFGAGPVYGWQGTRGQLILHEVGHAIGLAHPHLADPAEIMSPTMTRKAAEYAAGDRTGLRLVGAGQGCLSTALPGVIRSATTGSLTPPLHWSATD